MRNIVSFDIQGVSFDIQRQLDDIERRVLNTSAELVGYRDVKPWDDETDMKVVEQHVRSIEADGLLWGACKKYDYILCGVYVRNYI